MTSTPVKNQTWDVAVIGGGLAGAMAAYHLAKSGASVIVFEKESGPHHKVCGEFISGEGIPLLEEVGLNPRALGGREITGFRLHGPKRSSEAKLPAPAIGLSRFRLDHELLARVEQAGAEVRRGVLVREFVEEIETPGESFVVDTSEGEARARRVVVATGKHEFRMGEARAGLDSGYVGFKMHVKLKPSMRKMIQGHCDLFVFENGYGGLSLVEGDHANFCFLIERSALRSIGTDWHSLTSHISHHCWQASHYLDGAEPLLRNFVTIGRVPYGYVRRQPPEAGVFCVGDQMAVIPSLTGDGMTIAMMTGRRVADWILAEEGHLRAPAEAATGYHKEMRARLRPQVDAGFYLHRLFRHPSLCDVATYAVDAFPGIIERIFLSTRCQLQNQSPTLHQQRLNMSRVRL